MGLDLQSSSWDSTSRCSGPNCSPQSTIRYVRRCSWGNTQWRWPRIIISRYCRLSNQMGSPSSHVLRVFPPVKRSCRSGGQKGKAHANGQRWPTGSLNNDDLLRALLQARNTPDPDCNISPAQVVFGRPIRDAFSFISRCIKYNNPSIHPTWREAWSQKEDATRARMPRSTEALDMHTRPLAPLLLGDKVFLQNQRGSHPKKSDKLVIVVELGNYDQYWVKVDGSGRLSLRNRRFLRKFVPPSMTIGDPLSHSRQSYSL